MQISKGQNPKGCKNRHEGCSCEYYGHKRDTKVQERVQEQAPMGACRYKECEGPK